jgi:hypothetical protein
MAARTAYCDGSVDTFLGECRLVMAQIAEIGLICRKPLCPGVRFLMRHVFSYDPRMAGSTSAIGRQRPMKDLPFFPSLVTSHASVLLCGSRASENKKNKQPGKQA